MPNLQQQAEEAQKVLDQYGQERQESGQDAPANNPEPEQQAPAPAQSDDFQHKYQVLEGKYSADMRRLNSELRQLRDQNQALTQQVGSVHQLQSRLDQMENAQKSVAERLGIPQEQIDELGTDTIALIERVASQAARQAQTQTAEQLSSQVREQVSQVTAEERTARFWRDLGAGCPQYEALDTDPGFLAWVNQFDPATGQSRLAALQEAQRIGDGAAAAQIFNQYQAQPQQPVQPHPQPQQPAAQQLDPRIAQQVVPQPSASPDPMRAGNAMMPTEADFAQVERLLRQDRDAGIALHTQLLERARKAQGQ